jgi:hypothetical protein
MIYPASLICSFWSAHDFRIKSPMWRKKSPDTFLAQVADAVLERQELLYLGVGQAAVEDG